MQIARIGLAPGSQFTQQQHRRGAGRGMLHLLAQRLRGLALADRDRERRALPARRQPLAPPGVERPLHRAQQLGQGQRLLDEIESAEARGLDGGLDRAVTGHHHHGAIVTIGDRPLAQQRDAVGVRHPDIQQHQVRNLARARGARLGRIRRDIHVIALFGKNFLQQSADVRLVVHHQYSRSGHTRSLLCSPLRGSRTPVERVLSPNGNRIRTRAPPVR